MEKLYELKFGKTLCDFEYTKRSVKKMQKVLSSVDFENGDAEAIFDFMMTKVEQYAFGDYLKRYLYQKARIEEPFSSIEDDVYVEMLDDCFRENHVPISFRHSTRRRRIVFQSWLSQNTVKRDSVFLLGFALKMTADEITELLTKGAKGEDFNLYSPQESIYLYCYYNRLSFADAERIKEYYVAFQLTEIVSEKKWKCIVNEPDVFLQDYDNLLKHLAYLKNHNMDEHMQETAYVEYQSLFQRVCESIVLIYNESGKNGRKNWKTDDISSSDIEELFCSGMPRNDNGNLKKLTLSVLSDKFSLNRMNRQRVLNIIQKKRPVQRYDLITLLFFLYSETDNCCELPHRFMQFVDEVNRVLKRCNMMGMYYANPYEVFLVLCMLTEYPLASYSEVWELSYQ